MKRYRLLIMTLCVAMVGFNVVMVYAGEQNKISDEFRERFIKNFQRNSHCLSLRIFGEDSL